MNSKPVVVLMDGLGCDSSSLGHYWITHPESRLLPTGEQFDIEQLICLTSQTGNEWAYTAHLNETYKYPLHREYGIRTVQITRAGPSITQKYIVLDDTRSPTRCYIRGTHANPNHPLPSLDARLLDFFTPDELMHRFPTISTHAQLTPGYSLGENLLEAGTVSQYSESRRDCSPKHKGLMNDAWVQDGNPFYPSYTLGEQLLEHGVVPQYAGGHICQDHFKAETAGTWIASGYTLGEDLLESGVVPQYVRQRRKCSDKAKGKPCNTWVDHLSSTEPDNDADLEDLPLVYVAIGFTKGEERRRDRGDMAQSRWKSRKQPRVRRIDFHPLITQLEWTRQQTEWYATNVIAQGKEEWIRSACTFCPFSGIAGPTEEVLSKHRRFPEESGFALLVEHVSRRLNPKQTLYPSGRSLYQMLKDDGNRAALDNLQERLESLPWAVYRVQRVVGTPVPWRCTQILAVDNYGSIASVLKDLAGSLGATLSNEPDGFWRGWIEQNQWGSIRVEDLITIAPAVVKEKHRPGWHKTWSAVHQKQLNLFESDA